MFKYYGCPLRLIKHKEILDILTSGHSLGDNSL